MKSHYYLLTSLVIAMISSAQAKQVVSIDTGKVPAAEVTAGKPFLLEFASGTIYRVDGRNGVEWFVDEETGVMKDLGKVIIEPLTDKTFTLLVTRNDGKSYQIEVKPIKNLGNEHVVLKSLIDANSEVDADPQVVKNLATAQSRDKTIRIFIESMATGKKAKGVSIATTNEAVNLWQEANITITHKAKGLGMTGQVWELTNISSAPMTLDEREFFFNGVSATAIHKPMLQPGEMTKIYMVME